MSITTLEQRNLISLWVWLWLWLFTVQHIFWQSLHTSSVVVHLQQARS